MTKAATAVSSARSLLELGDTDGAVNRAYYTMFDAARATLLASGVPLESNLGRTHSGIIGAFGAGLATFDQGIDTFVDRHQLLVPVVLLTADLESN